MLTLIYTVLTIALEHKITSSYLFHNNDTFYNCIMCIHSIRFVIRLSLLILMFFLISVWRVCMLLSSQIVTVFPSLKVNQASKPHNESNTLIYSKQNVTQFRHNKMILIKFMRKDTRYTLLFTNNERVKHLRYFK